jgi:hypothetical protein
MPHQALQRRYLHPQACDTAASWMAPPPSPKGGED